MSGQRKVERKPRPTKKRTDAPSLASVARAQTEENTAPANARNTRKRVQSNTTQMDEENERVSEILGERQAHQVISNDRLYHGNQQKPGE